MSVSGWNNIGSTQRGTIVTVDPPNRRIEARLKDQSVVEVAVWEINQLFRWPVVGEVWSVNRVGGVWRLGEPIDTGPDAPAPIENLQPGDARIYAPGTTYVPGETTFEDKVTVSGQWISPSGANAGWVWQSDVHGQGSWVDPATLAPIQQAVTQFASGDVKPTAAAVTAGTEPVGWLFCDGRSLLRADYPILFTALGATSSPYGLPDGTHFNLPDYRGRTLVGVGTHTEVNALTKNDGLGVGSRKVKHRHGTDTQGSHSHGGTTSLDFPAHQHPTGEFSNFLADGGSSLAAVVQNVSGAANFGIFAKANTGDSSPAHGHSITSDGNHSHAVGDATGPLDGEAFQTVNWLIKT